MQRLAAVVLGLQGLAVAAWWAALAWWPESRAAFLPEDGWTAEFRALLLPDLALLGAGSLAAGWLLARGRPAARAAACVVAGAALYAALFTLGWARAHGAPALSPLLMAGSALLSCACARLAVQARGPGQHGA
jgi:hypothetical protein